MEGPAVKSAEEQVQYWKDLYQKKSKEYEDLEQEFNEFRDSSKELEATLEGDLDKTEKKLKELTTQYNRLKTEHEEAMDRSRRVAEESSKMIHTLQDESSSLKTRVSGLQKERVALEQLNDDLERRERELHATATDLTDKLNKVLEDNAWLQTELEEHNWQHKEVMQRMKDENRSLREELSLAEARRALAIRDSRSRRNSIGLQLEALTPPPSAENAAQPLPASLGLVEDILSVIKSMEKRFAIADEPFQDKAHLTTITTA